MDEHGRTRVVRGAVCARMERLHRPAHRVARLNPLRGVEGYAPLARGMAAALPDIGVVRPGRDLQSLEEMAVVVAGL